MKAFFRDENNIKWLISLTFCVILLGQAADVIVTGDEEIKKLLLFEVCGLIGVIIGYYFGSAHEKHKKKNNGDDK